jgi:hypothetical protein
MLGQYGDPSAIEPLRSLFNELPVRRNELLVMDLGESLVSLGAKLTEDEERKLDRAHREGYRGPN